MQVRRMEEPFSAWMVVGAVTSMARLSGTARRVEEGANLSPPLVWSGKQPFPPSLWGWGAGQGSSKGGGRDPAFELGVL